MPRPREFDEQDAVARACALFHRRGYQATSTRDLGEALGLNPSSIYRTFGDKRALFLHALDHYRQCQSARFAEALAADRPVRELLRDWLYDTVDPTGPSGCFVVNTAVELGTADQDAVRQVQAAFDGMVTVLAGLLRRGTACGQLPADLDPDATADLLFTTATGLRVRHRAGHDARQLRATADQALRSLG